jgi:hypothetical protein
MQVIIYFLLYIESEFLAYETNIVHKFNLPFRILLVQRIDSFLLPAKVIRWISPVLKVMFVTSSSGRSRPFVHKEKTGPWEHLLVPWFSLLYPYSNSELSYETSFIWLGQSLQLIWKLSSDWFHLKYFSWLLIHWIIMSISLSLALSFSLYIYWNTHIHD